MTEHAAQLPAAVRELFNGRDLAAKQHEAFLLLTVSEDHWPHAAMVGVGEVVATGLGTLRLALWPGTKTTTNILRTGKATLVLVWEGQAHYVYLTLQRLPQLADSPHPRERFAGDVTHVKTDHANYADLTSGVRIELKEPAPVLKRWQETIEDLLR
jgi:hypothetical protein